MHGELKPIFRVYMLRKGIPHSMVLDDIQNEPPKIRSWFFTAQIYIQAYVQSYGYRHGHIHVYTISVALAIAN